MTKQEHCRVHGCNIAGHSQASENQSPRKQRLTDTDVVFGLFSNRYFKGNNSVVCCCRNILTVVLITWLSSENHMRVTGETQTILWFIGTN